MFSSPTPAPGSRTLASNALRNAGLIDRDAKMRDATDKPGGRKGSSKTRSHRTRPIDVYKDSGPNKSGSSSSRHTLNSWSSHPTFILPSAANPNLRSTLLSPSQLSARMNINSSHGGSSDPLTIRGASSRPATAGRLRRNAVSGAVGTNSPSLIPVRVTRPTLKGVEPWRKLVQKRWNSATALLDLSNLIEDEIVKQFNLLPPGHGGNSRDAAVVFKLAKELKPQVQSLNLAKNRLNGQHLSQLSHYLPGLVNLSLQDNDIRTYRDLDFISGKKDKLTGLKELLLAGNPLRDEMMQKDAEQFKNEVSRRFPSLLTLDGQPIAQISFDVSREPNKPLTTALEPSSTTFPAEMSGSLIVGVDGALLSTFLVRFFSVYDSQRAALNDAYDATATFSYSCNTSIPERARTLALHHKLPNQRKLEWGPWLDQGNAGSRNLTRLSHSHEKQVQRLFIGGEAIANYVSTLPTTKHDISGPPEKFCVDCFPVAHGGLMGLLVMVHGEFTELPAEGLRSFDRTFVLVPAPEGSRAKLSGWDVVIISDQWTIRAYSSPDAWKPGPMIVQPSAARQTKAGPPANSDKGSTPTILSPEQQNTLSQIPEPERAKVLHICVRTGLNVQFSVDCLTNNGWDVEKAFANFEQVKGTLARDAFL
ncbi:hypothetical protein J3R30DRAFT_3701151 [Lentinula aciculospora]|uniref:NTF2-like protein n=1 Tax=Lentinula aciculospora TaxID=153920 RepID=A0A9W9AE37_9AGAR|nr:hypothetical protein J3R30DRAFT_3701151 [Lentinula aciculospora]